ncbi:MAG: hypothetical protein DRQ51_01770 [Gammaproteobacteria bacterium]|nr:MAG: hypothetical protein DRQ51_01770 [Gammaproteobacteria bacterium]
MKNKFLIVGGGGREAAFVNRLMEDSIVCAILPHMNPTIIECVEKTGGSYKIADVKNPAAVRLFAIECRADYVFVSADDPLACGVVDELLKHNIKAVGGTADATRIEWDKIYSIEYMNRVCPEHTPFYKIISKKSQIQPAIDEFIQKNKQIVVKPQGLTGGKGVKVMPDHLPDFSDVLKYATELLDLKPAEKVLLMEKISGFEFTIMGLTDGDSLQISPATYDYPYRYENDKGAGTGGMGCFTQADGLLPFLISSDIKICQNIMTKIIKQMKKDGLNYSGVLNGGFFKNKDGIFFMEYNSRFGDPEALNILKIIDGSFADFIVSLYEKTLDKNPVKFIKKASVVKYLVAKEYPLKSFDSMEFIIDDDKISKAGVDILYGACYRHNGKIKTLKSSRILALINTASVPSDASDKINKVIKNNFSDDLEYRSDIGSKQNLKKLSS